MFMDELRRAPRLRTYRVGRIAPDRLPAMNCLICNMSETGACLQVKSGLVSADDFNLIIMPEQTIKKCRVAWREARKIGVRFI
jgi:hypothetical protein